MGKIYKNIEELIGHTPLVQLCNLERENGLQARLLVKLEYLNPAGSVKDRAAREMIADAEEKGLLREGLPSSNPPPAIRESGWPPSAKPKATGS